MKSIETGRLLAGKYYIEGSIGKGGMGKIYRALQGDLERPVAVKIIELDAMSPEMRERFRREMKLLMRDPPIPNVVTIYDYGEFEGHDFFVMQLLTGGSLKQRMDACVAEQRPLPSVNEVNFLAQKIGTALYSVHQYGIIHRDIKPNNIMFDSGGNPYVIDFGIARDIQEDTGERLTKPGYTIGTIEYMCMAQRFGENPTPAFDIYSFAVMLYELLTGYLPYHSMKRGRDADYVLDVKNKAPLENWRSDLPVGLRQIFEKVIWQDHGYDDALKFAADFQAAIQLQEADTGFFTFPVKAQPIDIHDLPSTLHSKGDQSTVLLPKYRIVVPAAILLSLVVIAGLLLLRPSGAQPAIPDQPANPVVTSAATSVNNNVGSINTPAPSITPLPMATITPSPTACDILVAQSLVTIDQWQASGCVQLFTREDPDLGTLVLVPCLADNQDCNPLWMNKYEIRRGQANQNSDKNLPWTNITPSRARNWCSDRNGRLLTVTEWQHASGAEMGLVYPWGAAPREDYPQSNSPYESATYPADESWAGVIGMGGNVAEFVQGDQRMGSHFRSPDKFRIDGEPQRLSAGDITVGVRCGQDWTPVTN